jgi:PAS domain S-box-containing protein
MKIQNFKELTVQATILSFIFSLFILIAAILIIFVNDTNDILSLSTILQLFKKEPLLLVFVGLTIILPLTIFLIFSNFSKLLSHKELALDQEFLKSHKITDYIFNLIREDFDVEYKIEDQDDRLGKSLVELRNTLKTNKEVSEKRRKEDEIRSWNAEGLAKFGEILRRDNNDIRNLAYHVIKELTDYVSAIQSGFYLLQGDGKDEKYFELIAFYAYGRKKFADKQIKWGNGIIGTCAIEQKTIYISELPDTYINITSGLGKSNPRCLVVTPLIANDELFGVFEIASLKELETHEIIFIERVSESTASILSAVKMNIQTARLLEESKAQAQTMVSQEEEMRQNMEELQATQEEAHRQAERFLKLESTVNHTMVRAEYAVDGTLTYANTRFLKKLEYTSNSEVEGKHISMFISKKDEEWFKRIWADLSTGGRHFEGYMKHITRTGKDLWTMATYTCIRDDKENVERILFLALDTTEHKKISLNLEGIVDAVNRSSLRIEFDINGNIKDYNESFNYLFKYPEKEVTHLTIFDLIDNLELELFNKKWESVVSGMSFHGQFKVKTKNNEEKWVRGAFSVVYDMYGDIEKIVYIGNDITNEKLMEIESKKQNEALKKQEKLLRESEKELSKKLKTVKLEMQEQFKEIEHIKIRNERTLEGALDAIITTSHDNKILFFNQAAVDLLKFSKDEVMGKSVDMLFSAKVIDEDDFVSKYVNPGDNKVIGKRKEVSFKAKDGNEISVLLLLSKAQVDKENTYTAFIQTIEV